MGFHNGTVMLAPKWREKNNSLLTGVNAFYTMDESSGTRVDRSGNGYNLTDNNTVPSTTGKLGDCASFSLPNGEYLSSTNAIFSPGNTNFSFSGWFYIASPSYAQILAKAGSTSQIAYYLSTDSGNVVWTVSSSGGSPTYLYESSFGTISSNTWYYIYFYHDADNDEIGISINDNTIDTASHTGGVYNYTGSFDIGGWSFYGDYSTMRCDHLAFRSRLLATSEVTAEYNSGNGLVFESFN